MKPYSLIIVGDSGVGKTTLTMRLRNAPVDEVAAVTIGVDSAVLKLVDPPGMSLFVLDLAGGMDAEKSVLLPTFARGARGIVLVYDVTRRKTFENLRKKWIPQLKRSAPLREEQGDERLRGPVLLVGNKMDLVRRWERGERPTAKELGGINAPAPRAVTAEELAALAAEEAFAFQTETSTVAWSVETSQTPFKALFHAMWAEWPPVVDAGRIRLEQRPPKDQAECGSC